MGNLGNLLVTRRKSLKWAIENVVRRAGYENVAEGVKQYEQIESGQHAFPDEPVLRRFTEALEIDDKKMLRAWVRDLREWDEPVELHVVVQRDPGHYAAIPLMAKTREKAEPIIASLAQKLNREVCLVLSLIRGVLVYPDGHTVEGYGVPCNLVGDPAGFAGLRWILAHACPGGVCDEKVLVFSCGQGLKARPKAFSIIAARGAPVTLRRRK